MDATSQEKVIAMGFRVIRKDDYPQPRIKIKARGKGQNIDWQTLEKFETKAARDRAFKDLMKDSMTISD